MPTKDPVKLNNIVKKSQAKIFEKQLKLCIRRDAHMWEPLQRAATDMGLKPQQYILQVVKDSLVAKGYMNISDNPIE